jgi:hypothetical protein
MLHCVRQDTGRASKIQLAAVGPQDLYLRGRWSLFRHVYKRASRFAQWTDQVDIPYVPGQRTSVDVPKSGDVLGDVWLRISLPAVPAAPAGATWTKTVGYMLLRRVRLVLDAIEIHNYERLWYDIADTLEHRPQGYDAMIGRDPVPTMRAAHELFVPLRFLTEKVLGFPLIAIPRASLKIDIEWEASGVLSAYTPTDPGITCQLLIDYYDVEPPERAVLTRGAWLAFQSVMDSDALSYAIDSAGAIVDTPIVRVNLGNVRFAVTYVAWVAYDETGSPLTYLDRPLDTVVLTFNKQERAARRTADYFALVQKYQHCATARGGPPGVYSFAYDTSAGLPTGSADFAGLAHAYVEGTVASGTPRFKLKVFVRYYNFLDIRNGSGYLVYV